LWGWTKSEVYKRKVDIRIEKLARISHAAVRTKKREVKRTGTTRLLRTKVVMCTEANGGFYCQL